MFCAVRHALLRGLVRRTLGKSFRAPQESQGSNEVSRVSSLSLSQGSTFGQISENGVQAFNFNGLHHLPYGFAHSSSDPNLPSGLCVELSSTPALLSKYLSFRLPPLSRLTPPKDLQLHGPSHALLGRQTDPEQQYSLSWVQSSTSVACQLLSCAAQRKHHSPPGEKHSGPSSWLTISALFFKPRYGRCKHFW